MAVSCTLINGQILLIYQKLAGYYGTTIALVFKLSRFGRNAVDVASHDTTQAQKVKLSMCFASGLYPIGDISRMMLSCYTFTGIIKNVYIDKEPERV